MPRITAIKGEIGTSGNVEKIEITGDAARDITSAITEEYRGDAESACDDIGRALEDGYPYWSANLLQGATETPLLDAVITYYVSRGLDFGELADRDRDEWLKSDTWTKHAQTCDGCGSVNFGSDLWTPSDCENCGAALPRLTDDELDQFVTGYVEAALWSTSIEEDYATTLNAREGRDNWAADSSMSDVGMTGMNIDESTLESMRDECRDFAEANYRDLREYVEKRPTSATFDASQGSAWTYAGHDFLLTRNGHGAGFWDRGLGELGERLTSAAKTHGETYLYVGDDGVIYAN